MNTLSGQITAIETTGSISLVSIDVHGIVFKSIIIGTPKTVDYLKKGHNISVLFKETEVIVGTGDSFNLSLQNKIKGTVKNIEKGELLSKLTMGTEVGEIVSLITSRAVEQLKIVEGFKVIAMIKTNEILLSE